MKADLRELKERVIALIDRESDVFGYGAPSDTWGDLGYGVPDFTGLKLEICQELDRFLKEGASAS